MENLIYQITNEIKCLDQYVKAMKKVEPVKRKQEDLENLQMHINNLKAWAGITDESSENSLHKHIVTCFALLNEIKQFRKDTQELHDVTISLRCKESYIENGITYIKAGESYPFISRNKELVIIKDETNQFDEYNISYFEQ